jgi:hypothetical protein
MNRVFLLFPHMLKLSVEPRIEVTQDDDGYQYTVKIDTPEGEEVWNSNTTYDSETEARQEGESASSRLARMTSSPS